MKLSKLNRDVHRWGSLLFALPVLVIVISGVALQLKKDWSWVQPPTQTGSDSVPTLRFEQILAAAKTVPEADVSDWDDIDRIDVRPGKGTLKVRCENHWELQLDAKSGELLQSAYRRSDLIESIHDGSFFHPIMKLWIFLPTAVALGILWVTGIYLFFLPDFRRWQNRRKRHGVVSTSQQN